MVISPDGALRRGIVERHPGAHRGYRGRRGRAELRLPAWDEPSAAWAPPWARCPNTSRWSPAGSSNTRRMPCIVKLTPNIADIRKPAEAAMRGGADAVSLINTINSITSVNLDAFSPEPMIDGKGAHGGYCGPAVKPIALNMVAEIARSCRHPRPADLRHRRRDDLARCGGIHGAGRGQRAGLHRRHDLWLQDRAGNDLGPVAVSG